ncbi:hypothetical protein [Georgenia deserti]|uniref:DUF222 domain-containing protein n=1 Tax=Georgenia deserti TaxID=2093781 RepID=A0ABW4KZJ2_9MICO
MSTDAFLAHLAAQRGRDDELGELARRVASIPPSEVPLVPLGSHDLTTLAGTVPASTEPKESTMAKIQITTEDELRFSIAPAPQKLLMVTKAIPQTPECAAAARELESAVGAYYDATRALKDIDRAEADHERKVRAEAVAAVEEGRAPKGVKRPDFGDARQKAQAHADALLAKAKQARRALDAQMAADAATESARNAERVPELYQETLAAIEAAREAFSTLLRAREDAIEQLAGNPDVIIRHLPWHGPVGDGLDTAEKWLRENARALAEDFLINAASVEPSLQMRRQMAAAGDLERLYSIELAEGWAITQYAKGYTPPLVQVAPASGGSAFRSIPSAQAAPDYGDDPADLGKYFNE